jgi:hypothetical protein
MKYVGGSALFSAERRSATIGCVGENAVREYLGKLYFIAEGGIYVFDGYSPPSLISASIQNVTSSMNVTKIANSEVEIYEDKMQVWFSVPTGTSTRRDKILVYDMDLSAWTKFNITASCIGLIQFGTNTLYAGLGGEYASYALKLDGSTDSKNWMMSIGKYNGYIHQYGISTNDDGTAINGYWVTPWIDMEEPDRNKRIMRVALLLTPTTGGYLGFYVYTDWDDALPTVSESVDMTSSTNLIEKRVDFTKPCRSFRIRFGTSAVSTPFTIHRIIVDVFRKGRTLVSDATTTAVIPPSPPIPLR